MTGIASDMMGLIIAFINGGQGVQKHVAPTSATSQDTRLLPDVKSVRPAITVVNNGTATVNIGFNVAGFPLPKGSSITFRWVNPAARNLVYNDLGTTPILDVIG